MIRSFFVTVTYTLTPKHAPKAHPITNTTEFVHKLNMIETDHMVLGPLVQAATRVVCLQHGWSAEDITQLNISWQEVTDEDLLQK